MYPIQREYCSKAHTAEEAYLDELKAVACAYGYAPEQIDMLLAEGFTTDELEEMFYCGEI